MSPASASSLTLRTAALAYQPNGSSLLRLMRDHPLPGPGRFGCYRISAGSPHGDVARGVECEVFREFFGNTPHDMAAAYSAYEHSSTFLLAVDRDRLEPAGALRIIEHSESGLKTLDDIARDPLRIPLDKVVAHHGITDLRRVWDIGTLAVLKPYRGAAVDRFVSTMLYGHLYATAARSGVEHAVTVLDKHAWKQLTGWFGLPFVTIADSQPFSYLGSEMSRAAILHVPSMIAAVDERMRTLDPAMRKLLLPYVARLTHCEGLPAVVDV